MKLRRTFPTFWVFIWSSPISFGGITPKFLTDCFDDINVARLPSAGKRKIDEVKVQMKYQFESTHKQMRHEYKNGSLFACYFGKVFINSLVAFFNYLRILMSSAMYISSDVCII